MKKRIFYFNITYGCNNNCVFCYSHNTRHDSKIYNELTLDRFKEYLNENAISSEDRVILNGGEPLMYSELKDMFSILKEIGCETVTFTNGRLLNAIDLYALNEKFRFVVPIHGDEEIHDKITKVKGSYKETLLSMKTFDKSDVKCKLDLKIILNQEMIESKETFDRVLESLGNIYFNDSVHITKMADTIISEKNNCVSMNDNDTVSYYTNLLFNYFSKKQCNVKLFDTCIKDIDMSGSGNVDILPYSLDVTGKDYAHEEVIETYRNLGECASDCEKASYCLSSVFDYKVLEFSKDKFYENME